MMIQKMRRPNKKLIFPLEVWAMTLKIINKYKYKMNKNRTLIMAIMKLIYLLRIHKIKMTIISRILNGINQIKSYIFHMNK